MNRARTLLLTVLALTVVAPVAAEQVEINIAQQYGVSFLP